MVAIIAVGVVGQIVAPTGGASILIQWQPGRDKIAPAVLLMQCDQPQGARKLVSPVWRGDERRGPENEAPMGGGYHTTLGLGGVTYMTCVWESDPARSCRDRQTQNVLVYNGREGKAVDTGRKYLRG